MNRVLGSVLLSIPFGTQIKTESSTVVAEVNKIHPTKH